MLATLAAFCISETSLPSFDNIYISSLSPFHFHCRPFPLYPRPNNCHPLLRLQHYFTIIISFTYPSLECNRQSVSHSHFRIFTQKSHSTDLRLQTYLLSWSNFPLSDHQNVTKRQKDRKTEIQKDKKTKSQKDKQAKKKIKEIKIMKRI